jgi:hypothetical protein
MAFRMELVAGESQDILVAIAVDDREALDDRSRFAAHLSLGGILDPTWLDLYSEAMRAVTGGAQPRDFIDARSELEGPSDEARTTIERIDPGWISAIARIDDGQVDAVAGRWIDLIHEELGDLPREEKPWIRKLAGEIVEFARRADRAPDVLLAWSL